MEIMQQMSRQVMQNDPQQAARWLQEVYGLTGELTALPGEHDANYKLQLADGRRFLFKCHATHLSDGEVMLQADTLADLAAAAPDLPMQRLEPATNGALLPVLRLDDGTTIRLRLTTWIEGEVWGQHDWQ